MTEIWVCTSCKSINRQRDTRCYSCGNRKDEVAAPAEQGPMDRVETAIAYRTRRGYTPSWPLGAIAGLLIAIVAVLGLWIVFEQYSKVAAIREAVVAAMISGNEAQAQQVLASLSASPAQTWHGPLTLLAVLAFGAWLARVCINIPLLGGGVPEWTPVKAFLYPIIPILNLIKVPGYIQDAMYRLDPAGGGFYMVLGALLGLFGSWLVSVIGTFVIAAGSVGRIVGATTIEEAAQAFGSVIDQSFLLGVITELMTAGGAILLAVIILRVERRASARNAEIEAAVLADPRFADPVDTSSAPAPASAAAPGGWGSPAPSVDDAPLAGTPVGPAATATVAAASVPAPAPAPVAPEPAPAPAPVAPEPAPAPDPAPGAALTPDPTPAPAPVAPSGHQPRAGVPVYRPTSMPPADAPAAPPSAPPVTPPAPDPSPSPDPGPPLPPPPPGR